MKNKDRILQAAREGRIGFYEGPTELKPPDPEFGGMGVQCTHGVCEGCIWDVELAHEHGKPPKDMCGGEQTRVATVEEVEAYLAGFQPVP